MTENRAKRLFEAYRELRKMLLIMLPLSIEIPDLRGGYFKPGKSLDHVVHAREVLQDLPADPDRKHKVDQLMLDWLCALIMTRMSSVAPWYGDIADDALTRFWATVEVLRFEEDQQ